MVVVMKVEHLEETLLSCILKRWTKLAKVHPRSPPVNETDNDMDWIVRYASLSSMCNKLSYYASHTSSLFLEVNNEIENLRVRMEELYKNNLKLKKLAADGATSPHQVRDPNIVNTKGNPDKVASKFQNGRRCSRCKIVGHTIQKCPKATIPHTGNQRDMGMRAEHLWNDPFNMYIDFGALVNVPGFQQYEETITTPCEGGYPNDTPNENDM
ncbi:hypothetical protein CK203_104771 [Vitis vinifera]|uniref:Protein FAR1-RELATED SEQUENCE n=1 Tax=Vitis vinifera TaxID=29760 RepID=A0A438EQY0_VITVI|nr:hypothetical protein CK203_104771 [Vitis vinifera]